MPDDATRARIEREARDHEDIEIINQYAEALNREAEDTREYQELGWNSCASVSIRG